MNPLKPVRFYGSKLPRPRFVDEELGQRRVSPPVPVNDALLNWAKDANWYMGGLSTKRQRMQGKIEGRLKKLKDESEDDDAPSKRRSGRKSKTSSRKNSPKSTLVKSDFDSDSGEVKVSKRKSAGVRGRDGRGASESQVIVGKKPAAIHPEVPSVSVSIEFPFCRKAAESALPNDDYDMDSDLHLGDGPTVLQTPQSKVSGYSSSPGRAKMSNVPASVEYPLSRRGRKEGVLPDKADSDSDVDWEEFERLQKAERPSRRSSRVTKARRSFKEFASSDSEED